MGRVVETGRAEGSVLAAVLFSDYKLIRWLLTPVGLVRDFDMDAPAFWRLEVNKQVFWPELGVQSGTRSMSLQTRAFC